MVVKEGRKSNSVATGRGVEIEKKWEDTPIQEGDNFVEVKSLLYT